MNDTPIPGLAAIKPQAKATGPTCAGCRFMIVDERNVVCRRHPPAAQVIMIPGAPTVSSPRGALRPQTVSAWPLVMADWWCGEWKAAFDEATETREPGWLWKDIEARVGAKLAVRGGVPGMSGDDPT